MKRIVISGKGGTKDSKFGPDFNAGDFRTGRRMLFVIPLFARTEPAARHLMSIPSLAIFYLAAAAREAGYKVDVITVYRADQLHSSLKRKIRDFRPDAVGMSCKIIDFNACFEAARVIKSFDKSVHIVLGGPQGTAVPDVCLSNPCIDSVVIGEGEITLCALLGALGDDRKMSKVRGLAFRNRSGRIIHNPPRPLISDLDSLPLPALDIYPRRFWCDRSSKKYPVGIFISRGCPYRCTFCADKVTWRYTHRLFSAERVVGEMNLLNKKYGSDYFNFFDSTFTLNRAYVMELCELMLRKRRKKYVWTCGTRSDLVDLELLRLMKKAGCYIITYGFESGTQRILDYIRKDVTVEQNRQALIMAHEAGIKVGTTFCIGFPTETKKEILETIRFAVKVRPDGCGFNIAIPYSGTDMAADALKTGYMRDGYTPDDLARLGDVWVPDGWTRKKLEKLAELAVRHVNPPLNEYWKNKGV